MSEPCLIHDKTIYEKCPSRITVDIPQTYRRHFRHTTDIPQTDLRHDTTQPLPTHDSNDIIDQTCVMNATATFPT